MATKKLIQQRDRSLAKLHELLPQMLIGSLSETYRTCGTASCRCHTKGPKHGPHLYVSFRGEHGRTTGYYVPKVLHPRVRDGLAAWKEFQTLAKQVAQLNKEIMHAENPPKTRSKRTKRK